MGTRDTCRDDSKNPGRNRAKNLGGVVSGSPPMAIEDSKGYGPTSLPSPSDDEIWLFHCSEMEHFQNNTPERRAALIAARRKVRFGV